jgi:hypothetical protein
MPNDRSVGKRWGEYRPSKGLWLWSCVGSVIATIVVGFAWGGWVTGGTAMRMSQEAAAGARAQLAAAACYSRFESSPDAASQLAALKEAYSYQRSNLIDEKGWTTMPGGQKPVAGAANLCADRILEAGLPATSG